MTDRLDDLLQRWDEDTLDEAGTAELTALLAADPSARRRLVHAWSLSSALASLLRRRQRGAPAGWREHTARHLANRRRARAAPHTILRFLPLAAAAMLAIGLGLWFSGGDEMPPAAAVVMTASGGSLQPGQALPPGSSLELPAGATATLRLADGAELRLAGATALDGIQAASCSLLRGQVDVSVEPRLPGQEALVMRTPHGRVEVVGTRFDLAVGPAETTLTVDEGTVRAIRPDGNAVVVAAGWRSELRDGRFPVAVRRWTADDLDAALVTGEGPPDAGERAILQRLSRLGLRTQVLVVDHVTPALVDGLRLVVISNRLPLHTLQTRLPVPACPVVVLESGAWAGYGLPLAVAQAVPGTRPVVGRPLPAAPAVGGWSPGALLPAGVPLVRMHPHARVIVVDAASGEPLVGLIEPGEPIEAGPVAAQRRVAWPVTTTGMERLTPHGWDLFEHLLRWTAELPLP